MAHLPESISTLAAALTRLPGIGPRSAERISLYIVQADTSAVKFLAEALLKARESVHLCSVCGALTDLSPCRICSDVTREPALVCVVEKPVDILSVEKSGTFRGKYHVLGGKISPLNGVQPGDLRIADLERRLSTEPIREIILALGTDVEGDATAFYIAKTLAKAGLRISRIAHGLPAGSALEGADELTLSHALEGRREMK